MREVLQSLRSSTVDVVEVAPPQPSAGHLLVRSAASLVSAGTERMLVEFASAGLIGKARQQPERVRRAADKVRTDGLLSTADAIRSRLAEPLALGYANSGYVQALGAGVSGFEIGQLVASNGPHAEVVSVPTTLCAAVPAGVPADQAAFATVGAIALQGIRLAAPSLGERFVVTGLGLIGLLTVQLLRAHGCEVIGLDPDPTRLELARHLGAEVASSHADPVGAAVRFSRRASGVDGVVITASTSSSEPVHQAAQMCRKRGRIVLVGVTGLELRRSDFYEKELSFQVSCSYGPGRYDPGYEDAATDYPPAFVRWTAGRNMEAVLDMMASGRLDVGPLISHRFAIDQAAQAYAVLTGDPASLGILLEYPADLPAQTRPAPVPVVGRSQEGPRQRGSCRIGVIGAGSFATAVMLPALKATGADLVSISARGGRAASVAAQRFGIDHATNDAGELLADPDIDAVVVLTRHDSHARLVTEALDAGKDVFVEKPLAIDQEGLDSVIAAWNRRVDTGAAAPVVAIGFNRRFAPFTRRMKDLLADLSGPSAVTVTVNAGPLGADHWSQDPLIGGGRIRGEACHFIDLARHLAGSPIVDVSSAFLRGGGPPDSASVTLRHEDGSLSSIGYFSNGSKRFPKERITAFRSGRTVVNDNFRRLSAYGWRGRHGLYSIRQDKGHAEAIARFVAAVRGGAPPPIPFEEIVEVSTATLLAAAPGPSGERDA